MHPGIAVTEGDAEKLPYPDGAFDAVVSDFGISITYRAQTSRSAKPIACSRRAAA